MSKAHLVILHGVSALSLACSPLALAAPTFPATQAPAFATPQLVEIAASPRHAGGPLAGAGLSIQQRPQAEAGPESQVAMASVRVAPATAWTHGSPPARQAAPAVPMPGAPWLFGSALVVFVAIAARRSS